jgi:hypothetical protein
MKAVGACRVKRAIYLIMRSLACIAFSNTSSWINTSGRMAALYRLCTITRAGALAGGVADRQISAMMILSLPSRATGEPQVTPGLSLLASPKKL